MAGEYGRDEVGEGPGEGAADELGEVTESAEVGSGVGLRSGGGYGVRRAIERGGAAGAGALCDACDMAGVMSWAVRGCTGALGGTGFASHYARDYGSGI